jgi:1-deoxy-D-xylulose-5-phosphate synthase
VTFVLDRAGITGPDGASHHGMWDLALLKMVPGLRLAAPRDATTLRDELAEAVDVDDAPTVVRFPKGVVPADIADVDRAGGMDVLRRGNDTAGDADVLIVSVGALAETCLEVADRLADQGIAVTVVDPRWVTPVDPALAPLAARHRLVVVVEDGVRGGVSGLVAEALRDARVPTPLRDFGVPVGFVEHGKRAEVLASVGLTAQEISREVVETVARIDAVLDETVPSDQRVE